MAFFIWRTERALYILYYDVMMYPVLHDVTNLGILLFD